MAKPIIKIKNMSKSYELGGETVKALQDVCLTIDKGDFISIIGPSGSGKSTFMNMIGCLDKPDIGEYLLDGKEVEKMKDNELAGIRNIKIGFIFQNFNLLAKLTALENVELPLVYRGASVKERREVANALIWWALVTGRIICRPNCRVDSSKELRLQGHLPVILPFYWRMSRRGRLIVKRVKKFCRC